MKIHFLSSVTFEPWDWRNSIEQGIGGSETSQVEMAWRLAARGHEVICYGPIPPDCPGSWRGTTWKSVDAMTRRDFRDDGLWIVYRAPALLAHLQPSPTRRLWFLWQDWDYPGFATRVALKAERHITLCQWHGRYMRHGYPHLSDRIWLTSNGLKRDLLEQIEAEGPLTRDSHRVVFASSPDRGLLNVIQAVARAREVIPTLTLHTTYGFSNLDKIPQYAATSATIKAALDQPWIINHGRVSQPDLYRLWLSAGLWVYPTTFHETSCITAMEAQAAGAVPIVSPVAALAENVRHGVHLSGNPTDPLVAARFAGEIIRFSNPDLQASIRPAMMADARARFDWDRMVDQWDAAMEGTDYAPDFPRQLPNSAFAEAVA